MENLKKLIKAFSEALEIPSEKITDELSYGNETWDSIAHLSLVASIETEFDIMLNSDDVIDMSSFKKAKEILKKYDINF
ncbi:MAG: acyl carrier protein [Bacteroidetes bacterium]|nr:acyl carrier protein [Bacteroidota bacterium]